VETADAVTVSQLAGRKQPIEPPYPLSRRRLFRYFAYVAGRFVAGVSIGSGGPTRPDQPTAGRLRKRQAPVSRFVPPISKRPSSSAKLFFKIFRT